MSFIDALKATDPTNWYSKNVNVNVGDGNNNIKVYGDETNILVGDGDNKIISYGDDATILGGSGSNIVGALGNDTKIGFQGSNDENYNNIAFWGDNVQISLGNGNNNVKTLDWANGGPKTDGSFQAQNYLAEFDVASHDVSWMQDDDIKQMASLVDSSISLVDTFLSKHLIRNYTTEVRDPFHCVYYGTKFAEYLNTYRQDLVVNGVSNLTITAANGNNDILVTLDGSEYIGNISKKTTEVIGTYTRISPLVVDYNQDGKVSAKAGKGVDLNNDGKADGCATDGDKMLAMSDINGNQKNDGAEVFGDQTVDPFTGKKLNAKNGFEALELVAKSAEKHTGMSIIDNEGNVDLAKLKTALNTVGINLGFVSDANNEMLEKLDKVASINVKNYTEQDDNSKDVQHRQLGSYTDFTGKQYKVDDVWFAV